MMLRTVLSTFALFCLNLSSTATAHVAKGDSGIEGPAYSVIQERLLTLQTEFPNYVEVINYGTSVRGKQLTLIKIAAPIERNPNQTQDPRPAVLIGGATHGNEYLNIADRLPEEFLRQKESLTGLKNYLNAGGVIYIVPIVNPDGYDRDNRENANNKDLNRDFPLIPENRTGFSQPETKFLGEFLETNLPAEQLELKVTVDYHCCIGALLYPWSYTSRRLPAEDLEAHKHLARKMVNIFGNSYEYGTTGEILGYRPWGTSKDYYYPKFGALTYTYEGKYRTENTKLDKHVIWWDWIFSTLIEE